MRHKLLVLMIFLLLAFTPVAGQTPIDLGNGFKPWGSYNGSSLDSVSLEDGNLILHAPIIPIYPQRGGKLDPQMLLYVSSRNWPKICDISDTGFPINCRWGYGGTGVNLVMTHQVSVHRLVLIVGDPITSFSFLDGGEYSLITWDGATHHLFDVSNGTFTKFETMDGSDYQVEMSNPDQYGVNQTATVVDRRGTRSVSAFAGPHCSKPDILPPPAGLYAANGQNTAMEYDSYQVSPTVCNERTTPQFLVDSNGNRINTAVPMTGPTPPVDTMGRTIWPLQYAAYSDIAGCENTLPFSQSVVSTFEGVNGASNQVKVCYGTITPQTAFNVPNVTEFQNWGTITSFQQPTTIILPDSNKWVFSYDTYGDLLSISLPTGGLIRYTWKTLYPAIAPYCAINNSANPMPAARAIETRTLIDNNGHTSQWTYHWGTVQPDSTVTNWVTDPAGNDTVHTFKMVASTQCLGAGYGPQLHEVTTQYWQGLKDSGTLFKQVDTGYGRAILLPDNSSREYEANVVPTDITTTLFPSNKVSLVHKDYDSAFGASGPMVGDVTSEKDYDWGQGAPGPLLRETDTVYQWQKDSAYFTAHMLDLPASSAVISPVGSANTKSACPVAASTTAACMAETDYYYDETPVQPHLGTPPAGTLVAPPNPVRGNLTTVSHWLSTSNTLVSGQNVWFDTGMLAQVKDPLGHATSYSYDPTETYVTQTCNSKSQCVYGGYDFNTGLLTSFTDINGSSAGDLAHTTTYDYDPLTSRLTTATLPPDPSTGLQAQTRITYSDITNPNVFPVTVTRTRPVTGTLVDSTTTMYDGLGRPYKTEHAMPSGPPAAVDTVYDDLGRAASVSNPYFNVTDSTYGITTTIFDPLDRPTSVIKQDGSVSTADYSAGNCTVSIDEAGNPQRSYADALGRLVEVDEPTAGTPATSGSGSVTIGGGEQSTQVVTTPATSGTGSVLIGGAIQWKTVSNASTGGTTSIAVAGGEQQYPVGVIAGTGTITFSGSEQVIPATPGGGSVTIGGVLQSTQVQTQAATAAGGSVTISGTEQSVTTGGDRYCAAWNITGTLCVDWEINPIVTTYDSGSVTITVNGHPDAVSFDSTSTTATIAAALATAVNGDTAASVTASASGATVYLTSKSAGAAANLLLASSYTHDTADFASPSFTTSNSGSTLTGGQDAVTTTVYDSGTCSVAVNGHANSSSWSGPGTTPAAIASALAGSINADTVSPVTASASTNTLSLTAKAAGVTSNYTLSSSCSYDTGHFAAGSFTTSSGAALTGGGDAIPDSGTFSVTVNGHTTTPATAWGANSAPSTIAADLAANVNADTAAAVTASASGSTVTLTAKIKGSISNYSFSVSPTYDVTHFATPSFANSDSGATLTGGWPDPTAVDSGTMTVTVNAKPYTVSWGQTDTPGSIAANLATALATDLTVTPTLSGATLYLNPKQAGTVYGFSTAYTYDSANFSQSSFNTANAKSDYGTLAITVGGHTDNVPWAGLSTPASIAADLASQINADGLAAINAAASAGTLSLSARTTGTAGNYALASSITFDSTTFAAASFTGTNSGAALTGGANAVYATAYDSGTFTLSLGGSSYSVNYGQSDTPTSVAASLAGTINAGGMVSATASAGTLALTANGTGSVTNYSLSSSSATTQPTLFASSSFGASFTASSLIGGADEVPGTFANPQVTLYSYDALGNLLCVEQHGDAATGTGCSSDPSLDISSPWRVRRFTYDSLSRLLTASNPESSTAYDSSGNPVRVPTSYAYDADGNLLQKTSPAPNQSGTVTQTISYCYDELHRLTGKAYGAQVCPLASPAVTYAYDVGPNAIGHLTGVTDQAGSASYSYDALGRLASETRVIAGISKTISYDYNLDGSLAKLHYPSGATVTYTPDSAGRITDVVDSGNGINYVTGATYGPDGSATGFINGGLITSTFSYNRRLQPINMSASTVAQTVFSIGYDFHVGNGTTGADNGNVWGITNYRDNSRNQSFNYDSLNRLISAQNAGTDCTAGTVNGKTEYWGNSYGYDAWGNLTRKSITKCGAENLTLTALVNNQLSGYGYDAAGNMTSNPTDHVTSTYDPENRIATAATLQGTFSYVYDADGNRVEKTGGGTGTLYWYMTPGIVGESDLSGIMKSEYVFFNGERVALRDLVAPGGVFYYLSDHLKTASVITDSAGNIKAESDYYPWGGELQFVNNDSNHYKFTGKERDSESGLDYFGARYYSNGLGRFITPDWAAKAVDVPYAEFSDPQSLNLYTYVRNIPTTRYDADGHQSAQTITQTLPAVAACAASEVCAVGVLVGGAAASPALAVEVTIALPPVQGPEGSLGDPLGMYVYPSAPLQNENTNASSPTASSGSTQASGSTPGSGSAQPSGPKEPYKRPNNATTREQRASVQGKPCATCGKNEGQKNNADHKDPLVVQHYRNGQVDTSTMRDINAVQPQCPPCSNQQGGILSSFSREMKKLFGFN